MKPESCVRIAVVLPDLLGTYGDGGNAIVLERRLRWRGIPAEVVTVRSPDRSVPDSCDVYLLGGGEDVAQQAAVTILTGGGLHRAVERGAAVLGVCGGLQLLGNSFTTGDGTTTPGLGLLDADTRPGRGRAIGDIAVRADLPGVGALTGFENHLGRTLLGPGSRPLGQVLYGVGNGGEGDGRDEGAVTGRVVGTYLHGPVLARNPALADLLLAWATGLQLPPLPEFPEITRLRRQRIPADAQGPPASAAARA